MEGLWEKKQDYLAKAIEEKVEEYKIGPREGCEDAQDSAYLMFISFFYQITFLVKKMVPLYIYASRCFIRFGGW